MRKHSIEGLRVGVLRGGPSSEYDISLRTGSHILRSLPDSVSAQDIFISRDGAWHIGGVVKDPRRALAQCDVVINGLHGIYGEDGKVQQILDLLGVPYTGSSAFASALTMNKALTKETLRSHGFKVPTHKILRQDSMTNDDLLDIFRTFPQPSVVKPVRGGSSLGVRVVFSFKDLMEAVEEAFTHHPVVMVEEYIRGREASAAVIESSTGIYALHPVEIVDREHGTVFGYEAKYQSKDNKICPSTFENDQKKELQELALKAHHVLGLRQYSVVDYILTPRGPVVLEVNTLPGLTEHSLYPLMLTSADITMTDFLEHLILGALNR